MQCEPATSSYTGCNHLIFRFMLKKLILLALSCTALAGCTHEQSTSSADEINPIVGNLSFVEKFGQAPPATTDDDVRIRTHLAYAEQTLRQHQPLNLTPELRARREQVLDLLHSYWQAGVFPRNFDYPNERRPCFIDRDGRLCAVGYLVAETAGGPLPKKSTSSISTIT